MIALDLNKKEVQDFIFFLFVFFMKSLHVSQTNLIARTAIVKTSRTIAPNKFGHILDFNTHKKIHAT